MLALDQHLMKSKVHVLLIISFLCSHTMIGLGSTITSHAPDNGVIEASVRFTGTNNDPPANNVVFLSASQANIFSAFAVELTVMVPVGWGYQFEMVTAIG